MLTLNSPKETQMANVIYTAAPVVNIDTSTQAIAQLAALSKEQLKVVATTFASQAASLSKSLSFWTFAAIRCIVLMGACSSNQRDSGIKPLLFFGLFFYCCRCSYDVWAQVADANMWHDRAIAMIGNPG